MYLSAPGIFVIDIQTDDRIFENVQKVISNFLVKVNLKRRRSMDPNSLRCKRAYRPLKVRHFVSILARAQSRSSTSNIVICVGLTVLPTVVLLTVRQEGGESKS